MRSLLFIFVLGVWAGRVSGAPAALLDSAMQACSGRHDAWAFTQEVREFDGGRVKEERVERYDPSQPNEQRWALVSLNGRAPNADETADFRERKNRKKRAGNKSPAELFDLGRVAVAAESSAEVRYHVPLRADVSRFMPVDKFAVTVTVNKDRQAVEQVSARLREPIRIAFGLARLTDVTFDLEFKPSLDPAERGAATARPSGTARATLFKFGDRADFVWSDFRRVTPYALLASNGSGRL